MSQFKAVVLLPTYNEIANIQKVVDAICQAAPIDILIIDDNSPDGTGELADNLAERCPNVFVLHRAAKAGLGKAYVSGFHWAMARGYTHIIQMYADLSHPPAVIPKLLELTNHYDMVLGSRWVDGGGTENWSKVRQLISKCGSFYARKILQIPIRDVTGGLKCIKREVLETINLDELQSAGYVFQIEMTYLAIQAGFSVYETPIIFTERQLGESKMSGNIVVEAILRVPMLRQRRRR
ncbi:MAG: polyprenol monophosphomannose synthase [Deltaproteobacteria bacterium]|nr:polyprenol monophosphomannose synthase [Deltaproteobacteria bacterium]